MGFFDVVNMHIAEPRRIAIVLPGEQREPTCPARGRGRPKCWPAMRVHAPGTKHGAKSANMENEMSLGPWKMTGLAALVAAAATLATAGGASAVTPAMAGLAAASGTAQSGQLVRVGVSVTINPWWWGRPRYRVRRPGYRYFYGGYYYARPWWTLRAPAVVVPVPVPAPRAYGYTRAHVRWCFAHHRSYNPATNRFIGVDGRRHACRGPY